MKTLIWIIVAIVVVWGGWMLMHRGTMSGSTSSTTPTATQQQTAQNLPSLGAQATANDIMITTPAAGTTINGSTIEVAGKARGSWFFEASAPVAVVDLNGTTLGRGTIQAQGEWMTSEFVPFKGTISFSNTNGVSGGMVLFMNDNPSGQASTSKYVAVPVFFSTATTQ